MQYNGRVGGGGKNHTQQIRAASAAVTRGYNPSGYNKQNQVLNNMKNKQIKRNFMKSAKIGQKGKNITTD